MTAPYYADDAVTLYHGDCLDVLRALPDASVDAVVTDPPYGLADHTPAVVAKALGAWLGGDREHVPDGRGFMGRDWDRFVPPPAVFDECLRVLKPGGFLLSFAGSRTVDLMTTSVRFAGFEIRDGMAWLYGSGFPKSLDVSKAIDKANGRKFEDRFALGRHIRERREAAGLTPADVNSWFGYRDGCQHWERQDASGARVPTFADWQVLRGRLNLSDAHLPLIEREEAKRQKVGAGRSSAASVAFTRDAAGEYDITAPATEAAQQWQGWGTALKPAFEPIVVGRKPFPGTVAANVLEHGTGALNIDGCRIDGPPRPEMVRTQTVVAASSMAGTSTGATASGEMTTAGRWPTNVVLDESQAAELDKQAGIRRPGERPANRAGVGYHGGASGTSNERVVLDSGGASRFFPVFKYQAKAPTKERPKVDGVAHPTVKPLDLMRWLVRLVTPPGGTVLEPFAGSGTTAEACVLEGVRCIAIEREADYLPLIVARLTKHTQTALDFGGAA